MPAPPAPAGSTPPAGRASAPRPAALRYRCTACGNVTRFDVVTTRRTRAFHHYTVGGELQVEDEELLAETIEEVACRWCGSGGGVERVEEFELGVGDEGEPA